MKSLQAYGFALWEYDVCNKPFADALSILCPDMAISFFTPGSFSVVVVFVAAGRQASLTRLVNQGTIGGVKHYFV